MPETDDIELLAQYAQQNSESAFATLVERYNQSRLFRWQTRRPLVPRITFAPLRAQKPESRRHPAKV